MQTIRKKTDEPFLRSCIANRWVDGQRERWTNGIDPNSWDTSTTRVGLELNITKDPQMQSSENFEKFPYRAK